MAALVQTLPQQAGTVTLLQTRPQSASGASSLASATSIALIPSTRGQTMALGGTGAGAGAYSSGNVSGYRSRQSVAIAPYAFTSTPELVSANNQSLRQSSRSENQYSSLPPRLPPLTAGSASSSSSNSSHRSYISQDDSVLSSASRPLDLPRRPLSTVNLTPNLSFTIPDTPTPSIKPSPDRYRRGKNRPEGATNVPPLPSPDNSAIITPVRLSSTEAAIPVDPSNADSLPPSRSVGHARGSSADNVQLEKSQPPELAKRYRRRSWANMDFVGVSSVKEQLSLDRTPFNLPELNLLTDLPRPRSAHSHSGSTDSLHSNRSSNRSASGRESPVPKPASSSLKEAVKPLGSSGLTPDTQKRSPLSQQVSPAKETHMSTASPPQPASSPAAQRLADINRMAPKSKGKSRLRRAFSFGSAAELRKASAQNLANRRELINDDQNLSESLHEELDPEQAAIAAQQEANGLGESIYSHQGNFFSGSTDNLSISSTASSASIMLRKMGRGMKKSGRSLVGLFRPKSFVSAPTNSMTVEPTAPQVSMVNIEAERKTVTANPAPRDQVVGGAVYSKIDSAPEETAYVAPPSDPAPVPVSAPIPAPAPTSIPTPTATAATAAAVSLDSSRARKSIMGGEKERAEVLAAVRKGILKNSGNSSPLATPTQFSPPNALHNDSPHSSAPSTPDEHPHRTGHRRSETVKIEGEDYFLSVSRFNNSDSKSAPNTPQPLAPKTIVFSPRIQFHETWPSGEYDRRGEIATCNRLTPLLAQQIKEELNTFKMEMEVHETSKVYTHFL